MSTIHNPVNFKPEDYEVSAYFDNQPPQYYFGMSMQCFENLVAEWHWTKKHLFPDNQDIYHCAHCGNGMVRYIVACLHKPTGKNVVFGDICVHRLGFANADEFKSAQIRAKAELQHQRVLVYQKYLKTVEKYPALEQAMKEIENPVHERNMFAKDVIGKLKTYGELSERQVTALQASMAKDIEYAARKAAEAQEVVGEAPEGRVEVEGVVLAMKPQETSFGTTLKMLVKLTNNSKVWCTVPSSSDINKGDKIKVKATWSRKPEDKTFAFGKRPTVSKIENPAAQNEPPASEPTPTQNSQI